MEFTHADLIKIASDAGIMKKLDIITHLRTQIDLVRWRIEHNDSQKAKGDTMYYSETQETLAAMELQLTEGRWSS